MNTLSQQKVYDVGGSGYKFCHRCKFEGEIAGGNCQNCGNRLVAKQQIRVFGGMMLSVSIILIVGMAYLIYNIDRSIIDSGKPGSTTKWTLSPDQIELMFGVLYTVLAIGVSTFIVGLWHLVIGRRNLVLFWIIFGVTGALFILSKFLPE